MLFCCCPLLLFQDGMFWIFAHLEFQSLSNACCTFLMCVFISNCNVFAHLFEPRYINSWIWVVFILFIITLVSWKQSSYHIVSRGESGWMVVCLLFIWMYSFNGSDFGLKIVHFDRSDKIQICQRKQFVLFFSFAIGNCINNETVFRFFVFEIKQQHNYMTMKMPKTTHNYNNGSNKIINKISERTLE